MTCNHCKDYIKCTKICDKIKKILNKKPKGRLYSNRHIRRREIPYDPINFDMLAVKLYQRKYGKHTDRVLYIEGRE